MLLYLALYQNCDKEQLILQKVKKGRKVALIFPKPGWRENLHIFEVYETGVESLLKWPAEEGHPHSGTRELESLWGSIAFQQREREKLSSTVGMVTVHRGGGAIWGWSPSESNYLQMGAVVLCSSGQGMYWNAVETWEIRKD